MRIYHIRVTVVEGDGSGGRGGGTLKLLNISPEKLHTIYIIRFETGTEIFKTLDSLKLLFIFQTISINEETCDVAEVAPVYDIVLVMSTRLHRKNTLVRKFAHKRFDVTVYT